MKKASTLFALCGVVITALATGWIALAEEELFMPDPAEFLSLSDKEVKLAQTSENPEPSAILERSAEDKKAFVPPSGRHVEEIGKETSVMDIFTEDVFNTPVTLNFKDTELQDVLRLISVQWGLNIIMSKKQVTGNVTLHLTDVPLGVALESILKTNALAMVKERGGIVRIVPISEVRTTKVETRTIFVQLNWVTAEDLAKTLKPFLSREGSVAAAKQSNALIITDTPPNLESLQELIVKIDVPEKQVMIEARLVDMSLDALRELGVNWNMFKPDESGASSAFIQRGKNVFKDDDGNIVGPDLATDIETLLWTEPIDQISSLLDTPSAGTKGSLINFGRKLHFFGNDWDLSMQLNALEERDMIEVLASPMISTLNNMPAKILIKEEIPYAETEKSELGIPVGVEIKFKEASTELIVTPYITNNDFVRMTLEAKHMIFRKRVIVGTQEDATDVPIIDERSAVTNVIVKDEQTVVLGGLRELNRKNMNARIPWLGKIPILGWLFKSKINEDRKLEMILFVTPHIIKDPTLSPYEQNLHDQIDLQWHLPDKYNEEVDLSKYFETEK